MEIKYDVVEEIHHEMSITVTDAKNVFIEGRSKYNNTTCYLGIWQSNGWTKIVTIKQNALSLDKTSFNSAYVTVYIKKFMESVNRPRLITRDAFFRQLENIKKLLS